MRQNGSNSLVDQECRFGGVNNYSSCLLFEIICRLLLLEDFDQCDAYGAALA